MQRSRITASPWVLALAAAAFACGDDVSNYYNSFFAPTIPDAGTPGETAADAGLPADAGEPVAADGRPRADTAPESLAFDVFGSVGAHYWLWVAPEQVAIMNTDFEARGAGLQSGDLYVPAAAPTFVDHLWVTAPGPEPRTSDFGKVQVRLVGESTGRLWTRHTLPNFKIDTDEFEAGKRVSGVEHFRLSNAVVGSIFREKLALDLYEKLGYPAQRATHVWVHTNVWGGELAVPYIMVESYKRAFCERQPEEFAGECKNMWEFSGDIGSLGFEYPDNCQFSSCDASRASEFELEVISTPPGPGYKAALADWFDWASFHEFQCLSWMLGTGDDPLHTFGNNLVLVERGDGKFQHLPYSVDVSLGQGSFGIVDVPLAGTSLMALGCQSDPECWAGTIAACEALLERFIAADPVALLDQLHADLAAHGMLRGGDEEHRQEVRSYLERRLAQLPNELELNRDGPYFGSCGDGMVLCGDVCALLDDCPICDTSPDAAPPDTACRPPP